MATAPITYGAYGNDYAADQGTIDRQRKLADMLQQQSMQPLGQEAIGGVAIRRSPLEGLAKMAQAYAGQRVSESATESEKALSRKYAQSLADTLKAAQENPAQAGEILAQHPATQALGMTQLQTELANKRRAAVLAEALGGKKAPPVTVESPTNVGGDSMTGAGPGAGPQAPAQIPGQAPSTNPLGIPDNIVKLTSSGDPALEAIGKMMFSQYQEENKPLIDRGFGIKKLNPKTGKYELVSQLSDISDVEAAKHSVGANYSTQMMEVPVSLPGGNQVNIKLTAPEAMTYNTTRRLPDQIAASIGYANPQAPAAAQNPTLPAAPAPQQSRRCPAKPPHGKP